jgi:hypothetical protein
VAPATQTPPVSIPPLLPRCSCSGAIGEALLEDRRRGLTQCAVSTTRVLDDPTNPLALRYLIGESRLQVIKLSYPVDDSGPDLVPGAAARWERDLAAAGRVLIYGI